MNDVDSSSFADDIVSLLIGRLALENGLISEEILHKCRIEERLSLKKGPPVSLDEILIEKGYISIEMMGKLVATAARNLDKRIGSLAIRKKYATQKEIETALADQSYAFNQGKLLLLGNILVEKGIISEKSRDELLADQSIVKNDEKAFLRGKDASVSRDAHSPAIDYESMVEEPEIIVSGDGLVAEVFVPEETCRPEMAETLLALAGEKGIVYGLATKKDIQDSLTNNRLRFPVAKGKPPVKGADGELKFNFSRDYLHPGKLDDNGAIDYRDRGEVPYIEEGQVVAESIPPGKGVPGQTVYGHSIAPETALTAEFLPGSGVRVSKDGRTLYAALDGQPVVEPTGEISVLSELRIKKDVDYNTGNIDFSGKVVVEGTIMPGFEVRAGALVANEIESAKIDVKGDLDVKEGIISSDIQAGGSVRAVYAKRTTIGAYGGVYIKRELIDSAVCTGSECYSDSLQIISSSVSAAKGVYVKSIGTDVSEKCVVTVGVHDYAHSHLARLQEGLEEEKKALEEEHVRYVETEKVLMDTQRQITLTGNIQETNIEQKYKVKKLLQKMGNNESMEINGKILKKQFLDISLAELEEVVRVTDESLMTTMKEQDALTDKVIGIKEEIETIVNQIEVFSNKIFNLDQWIVNNKGIAEVSVTKELHAGTFLKGPNATKKIKQLVKNCHFKEKRTMIDKEPVWEFSLV